MKWKDVYKESQKVGNTPVLAVFFCRRYKNIGLIRHIRISIAERIIAKYLMTKDEYEHYKTGTKEKFQKIKWYRYVSNYLIAAFGMMFSMLFVVLLSIGLFGINNMYPVFAIMFITTAFICITLYFWEKHIFKKYGQWLWKEKEDK